MGKYSFETKWKELLVCRSSEGELTIECSMGSLHVYFPTEDTWRAKAPTWAKLLYSEILVELKAWCLNEKIPLTVDESAWVE